MEQLSTDTATRKLLVFDTTLRDGMQGRGARATLQGELAIAKALLEARMDVIEGGCPASNDREMEKIRRIVQMADGYESRIAAFAICREDTIDAARSSLAEAGDKGVISLLTSVSDVHIDHMFQGEHRRDRATKKFVDGTRYAADGGMPVHVYLEDATRADPQYLDELVPELCKAGATTISVPDTTGWVNDPQWYGALIARLKKLLPPQVSISAHPHDDVRMANANALAAVTAGVDQVEGTITGRGERIGNLSLEQFLYLLLKGPVSYNRTVQLNLEKIADAARTFVRETGIIVDPKHPLYGMHAYGSTAGIHQGKMLRNGDTYLAIDPTFLGFRGPSDPIIFGSGSGKNAIIAALESVGLCTAKDDPRLDEVKEEALDLVRETTEGELRLDVIAALAMNRLGDGGRYALSAPPEYSSSNDIQRLTLDVTDTETGETHHLRGTGSGGMIALACQQLSQLTGIHLHIEDGDWHSENIGRGEDSPEFIAARLKNGNEYFTGLGLHKDSTEAGISAVLHGFNNAVKFFSVSGTPVMQSAAS